MTSALIRLSAYEHARAMTAPTPFLAIDCVKLLETYDALASAIPRGEVFYAIKANGDLAVLKPLVERGSSFDVASLVELERVLACGVDGSRIICSNPIKSAQLLERCSEANVYAVVVDSEDEVQKAARHAPGMRIYVRLAVDNSGAVMPLDKKFGVSAKEALDELLLAKELGLQPIGLAFHVGSQCVQVEPWIRAIKTCGAIWRTAAVKGINLTFLDLGGGYPVHTDPSVPSIEDIGSGIAQAIDSYIPLTPDLRVIMEPGRGLVGESGVLAMTVVGRAKRSDKMWLYLDGGVFHGLTEILEGFSDYPVMSDKPDAEATQRYTLAGPTCDSNDTILRDVPLPEMAIGDRLYFLNAGAYTSEYNTFFNGFQGPTVHVV